MQKNNIFIFIFVTNNLILTQNIYIQKDHITENNHEFINDQNNKSILSSHGENSINLNHINDNEINNNEVNNSPNILKKPPFQKKTYIYSGIILFILILIALLIKKIIPKDLKIDSNRESKEALKESNERKAKRYQFTKKQNQLNQITTQKFQDSPLNSFNSKKKSNNEVRDPQLPKNKLKKIPSPSTLLDYNSPNNQFTSFNQKEKKIQELSSISFKQKRKGYENNNDKTMATINLKKQINNNNFKSTIQNSIETFSIN
jgi:hypothetical protein